MTAAEIQQISWEAIGREGERYKSPAWHQDALIETQQRAEAGSEVPIDWATAKRKLCKKDDERRESFTRS
ncbi:MAG: acyl-protein synthetase [Pseudomonadota bacterium]